VVKRLWGFTKVHHRGLAKNATRSIEYAQQVVSGPDAPLGNPRHDLKHNLKRFDYVLVKFGICNSKLDITAHVLRHEALIDEFVALTGQQPP